MSARWSWLRAAGGAAVLAVLLWRWGSGPFVHGVRTVGAGTLLVGAMIVLGTTVCCAWRWCLVARSIGIGIALPGATAACYRSQFLNTTLPGGVLGDVHRAVRHGREVADRPRSLRAVAWERTAGQVVLVGAAGTVLVVLPSPIRDRLPGGVAVLLLAAALATTVLLRSISGVVRLDLRGLLGSRTWPGVLLASVLAVLGHAAGFVVAARAAGATAPVLHLLPLALVALLAMAVPLNVAGWGPREGVSAWAFAASGLGAEQGLATAVVYGVMTLVANLPGAVILLAGRARTRPVAAVPVPSEVARG